MAHSSRLKSGGTAERAKETESGLPLSFCDDDDSEEEGDACLFLLRFGGVLYVNWTGELC